MFKSHETQDYSNEINESASLFRPSNLILEIGHIFYASIKKFFSKSPFVENNFGSTENDICNDLSEYFHGVYERALIGVSYDIDFHQPQKVLTQNEPNIDKDYNSSGMKSTEKANLVEEEPSIRIY